MLVSDVSITGLFDRDVKLRLSPGLVGVQMSEDARFRDVLRGLLFATGFDPQNPFATSTHDVKASCLLHESDGVSFRLLRDLRSGAAQLARGTDGQFTPVADGADEVWHVLHGQASIPSRACFEALYWLGADAFVDDTRLVPRSLSLLDAGAMGRSKEQIKAEIEALRGQRSGATARELEFELDGLQKQRYAYEEVSQRRQVFVNRLSQVDRELEKGGLLDALPKNFDDMAMTFDAYKQKFTDERTRLLDEQREREGRGRPYSPQPLLTDAKFMGGLVGGFVLLGISAFLDGDLRLIGLLDVAPWGLAAVQALGFVNDLEAGDKYDQRLRLIDERVKRIEQKFESDTLVLRNAVTSLGVERPLDVSALIARRRTMKSERLKIQEELETFDAGAGKTLSLAEVATLDRKMALLEDKLSSLSIGSTPEELDKRLAALEAELAEEPKEAQVATLTPRSGPPPFAEQMRALTALGCGDGPSIAAAMTPRVAAYAERLLGRAVAVTLSADGSMQADGQSFFGVDKKAQAVLRLALRMCAFELASTRKAFPLWIDHLERVSDLPHAALPVYYKHLAKRAQVVWLAAADVSLTGADSQVGFFD
jgi:hypothetical protein